MNVKLICVIGKETFKTEDGKEYPQKNYFLELDNGTRVAVKPCFRDDYKIFNLIAEKNEKH